jgi:hypothetical protein
MRQRPPTAIMMAMPRPLTASRVLLVADRRAMTSELRAAPLKRYRLARMRLDGRVSGAPLEHGKRA